MPWSNQSGGGGGWKGGGGGGPWGQGQGGGGGQPPDLEEMLKRSQDRMKKVMRGGGGMPGPLAFLFGAVAVAVVAWYGFLLPGQSGRAWCRPAFWRVCAPGAARPALPASLSHRGSESCPK